MPVSTICSQSLGKAPPVDGIVMLSNVPTFTPMYQRVRNGIGLATEDRLIFTKMSARDKSRPVAAALIVY